jgi:hypothetical protein
MCNFAEPSKDFNFHSRIENENTVFSQEAVGEERTKIARKTTELYTEGKMATGDDIKRMLCNFRMIMRAFCPDFEKSELWKCLSRIEITLHDKKGGDFIAAAAGAPQFALNLFVDIQSVLSQFVEVANTAVYRTALTNGDPISPQAYQQANSLAEDISHT